jgi:hypothetical protein
VGACRATCVSSTDLRRLLKQNASSTASESSSSSSPLSHHHDLGCPFYDNHTSPKRNVLRLSSALVDFLTLNPFFLLSYRCLSFPRPPPPDTRASRFILANKRPSLALPRPFQDFLIPFTSHQPSIPYNPATVRHVARSNCPLSLPSTPIHLLAYVQSKRLSLNSHRIFT